MYTDECMEWLDPRVMFACSGTLALLEVRWLSGRVYCTVHYENLPMQFTETLEEKNKNTLEKFCCLIFSLKSCIVGTR